MELPSTSKFNMFLYVLDLLVYNRQDSVPSPPTASKHASAATAETMASSSKQISEPAPAASRVQEPNEKMKHLERLHIEELKTWASDHSIPFPAHNKRKKNGKTVIL